MVERDVIGHLIGVERVAHDLVLDAQTEADRRKADAREKAEQTYRSAYEKIIAEMEKKFAEDCKQCDDSRELIYSGFKTRLDSVQKDQIAFNTYLDSIFFGT